MSSQDPSRPLFTCLSCSIAFPTADEQRVHYRSDHHRYNMKRRVASLPPVSMMVFNQKVSERHSENVSSQARDLSCEICSKSYTTDGAYRSHINSRRHKDHESKIANGLLVRPTERKSSPAHAPAAPDTLLEDVGDAEVELDDERIIEAKIAAAEGKKLSPSDCLFCTNSSATLEDNLTHMSTAHSFFIPDAEYLTDLAGLVGYLGEKIVVGNLCIYCGAKSKDFRTLEAVRKHMVDKSHCKIAYDLEDDRLEISDYYDFTSSYPSNDIGEANDGWEDMDSDEVGDEDEVVDADATIKITPDQDPLGRITYGDSDYELVLPSGARIGHRSMRRYYAQSFSPIPNRKGEDPNSGAGLVRRLIADKNSALVPRKGGFGAYGAGTDVIKVRNAGEAREAGRHVREYRDQRRREEFKTKVGFKHNSQKHYRDPLLQ